MIPRTSNWWRHPAMLFCMVSALPYLVVVGGFHLAMVDVVTWVDHLFFVPLWAGGVAWIIWCLHMSRRTAILDVIGDTLLVTESGLFGIKQHEWRTVDLRSIHLGCGVKINEKSIMQLQIQPQRGKALGIFTGRQEDELRWLASKLREALRLG